MLVDGPDRGDGLGSLAVLADALRPELDPPAGEALEAVRIAHRHGDVLAFQRHGDVERGSDGGRSVGRRGAGAERFVGIGRALADRRDVETEHGGRQKANIGEHGITAADPRVMLEERHALGLEEIAQGVAAAGLSRLRQAEEQVRGPRPQAGLVEGREHRDGLHQGLAGAARTSRSTRTASRRGAACGARDRR